MPESRPYKNFTPRMGVYAVRHLPSGRTLLDWSRHLTASLNRHRFQLDASLHPNKPLQADWQRDSAAAFRFEELDQLAPDPRKPTDHDYTAELVALESLWREQLRLTASSSYGPPSRG